MTDIVERINIHRPMIACGCNDILNDAQTEIESLRAENAEYQTESDRVRDTNARQYAKIHELRAELDAALRDIPVEFEPEEDS